MKTLLNAGGGNAAMQVALAWLESRHGEAAASVVDDMLHADLSAAERRALDDLAAATARQLRFNVAEWLLAEGRIRVAGEERAAAACVLGPDGPPLTAAGRSWLEQLAQTPLRFYELVAAPSGGGATLRDALDVDAAPIVVAGDALAGVPPGTRVGLRVLEIDGRCELSGAVYAFSRIAGASVAVQLRESADLFGADSADLPQMLSILIRHCWLAQCATPASARIIACQSAPADAAAAAACDVRDKSVCPGVRAHARKGDKAVGDQIEKALAAALAPKK